MISRAMEGQRGRRRRRGGNEAREALSQGKGRGEKPEFGRIGRFALFSVATAAKDALTTKWTLSLVVKRRGKEELRPDRQ